MPAPKSLYPSRPVTVFLDDALLTRIELHLYSEVERRIPKGAYKSFFDARMAEWLGQGQLDVSGLWGEPSGRHVIKGPRDVLERLKEKLGELE